MSLTVQESPQRHRYEAVDESGVVAGYVEYVDHRNVRVLFHTEVDPAFEGHGVGSSMARAVLDAVTGAGLTTRVTCPFLVSWIEEHPAYQDKVTLR